MRGSTAVDGRPAVTPASTSFASAGRPRITASPRRTPSAPTRWGATVDGAGTGEVAAAELADWTVPGPGSKTFTRPTPAVAASATPQTAAAAVVAVRRDRRRRAVAVRRSASTSSS
ncbi:hypothetical protein QLQ12_32750 [Actinoplanes sp. NEAU-A12]|uniref:Uncharacterized protein n=1 Tax=Actinoplanes sandaracinus TaxID=3045177 RepID=A0ABT6WUH3_9ACTN|nr:hypothetical protein [Actinoplanes sandaracinus]MDI6103389.1 hypothetical protein [Actinoplanes sandaracinus]